MKANRSYRYEAAAKAPAKMKKISQVRDKTGTSDKPKDVTGDSSKATNSYRMKTKNLVAEKAAKVVARHDKIKEFFRRRAERAKAKEREAYEKRRAARMIHSSNKLYLSHRVTKIINCYSPQSPIECISLTSQFTNSNSKISKITRDTRKTRMHLNFK